MTQTVNPFDDAAGHANKPQYTSKDLPVEKDPA
jgi:hypothetical protein